MKHALALCALLLLAGCDVASKPTITNQREQETVAVPEADLGYATVVIDSCQYLEKRLDSYNAYGAVASITLTHKGNCSNPWHGRHAAKR